MNVVRRLISEAHRRSVGQVLGIYLVGSWVGYQVILNVMEGFGLPDWVAPFALVLFLIGLPIVIATAFVQEGGPERADFVRRADDDPHLLVPGFATATDELTAAAPLAPPPGPMPTVSRHLTWPKALAGGLGAFLILLVSASVWMGMTSASSLIGTGELEARDPIVLASFGAAASDTLVAAAVTEAFRVDLEQSPVIRLVQPQQIADVLRRMQREPNSPLTEDLAREIAEREGFKALIAGEVNPIGTGWVLSARVVSADGRVLVAVRETALESAALIDAIDRLSRVVREQVGESLRTIRRTPPLHQVTTASVDALRLYTEAMAARNRGDTHASIELLEQAIAVDSGFAMAWRKIAAFSPRPDQKVHAATRAYELRDRLTESERRLAAGSYHGWARGDIAAAAAEYRALLVLDPTADVAINNLGLILSEQGQYEESLALFEQGVRAGVSTSTHLVNRADVLYALGRPDDAIAAALEVSARYPDNSFGTLQAAAYHAAEGRFAIADSIVDGALTTESRPIPRGFGLRIAGATDVARGRLREAAEHMREAEDVARRIAPASALHAAGWRAAMLLFIHDDSSGAAAAMERVLATHAIGSMEPLERPYVDLAGFFLRAGDRERARSLLQRREAEVPEEQRRSSPMLEGVAAFYGALLQRDLAAAERALAAAHTATTCDACWLNDLAAAYAEAGQSQRAIELYHRYLDERWAYRFADRFAFGIPPALLHLAELCEARGDLECAASAYARFVDLWRDADSELQPRVRAARARLESLVARRG